MDHSAPSLYTQALAKADEIEAELKRLRRWESQRPPEEKFDNMGAFGSNTMPFEQWLQFVLIPRIHDIVKDQEEFPPESNLATYCIRSFDGNTEAGSLHQILFDLDDLINNSSSVHREVNTQETTKVDTISYGDTAIPPVVVTLANLLPQYEGDALESQLQTFDTFLTVLSPSVRSVISDLLREAAGKTLHPASKLRILQAPDSVARGERAAEPYNHEEAMKKYIEEFKKSFPESK